MARARCGIGCEYTVYSGYLPWSFISLLPCSILSSRNPSPARFLHPAAHASPRSFLACSHHQPSLPQPSLPPLTLRACVASLLPLSLPLLSLSPSFSPSLPLFPLPPSLCSPHCLLASCRATQYTLCVYTVLASCTGYCLGRASHAWRWDNGVVAPSAGGSRLPWQRTPTTNPFLTNSKKSDGRNMLQTHINTVEARTFPTVHAATPRAR